MNTRLQVEHPVTELVTGIDLAKQQILIAAGEKLSFKQEDVKIRGHAIECRIYAEDPFSNFMPDTGTIKYLRSPGGNGIRVDSGVEQGYEVTVHFDPMLAKLCAWGNDRHGAIARMERALMNYRIKGLKTIIPFLLAVMQHMDFRYGKFDTGFIPNTFDFEMLERMKERHEELIAAIAAFGWRMMRREKISTNSKPKTNKWKENHLALRRMI